MVNINLNPCLLCICLFGFWTNVMSADCAEPEPLLNGAVTIIARFANQSLSAIQYYCDEPYYTFPEGVNVIFHCTTDGKWKDTGNSTVIPQCIPVCGRPVATNERYKKIMGGQAAAENTFPWHVLASTDGYVIGAGIVVGEHWIMTSTSIYLHGQLYVGNNNLSTLLQSTPLEVASLHPHPESGIDDNDIALIRLRHPLKFNASVMPVCLPPAGASYSAGRIGLVSGFGNTSPNGDTSEMLHYVPLPLVDWETCRASIGPNPPRDAVVTKNMICAGLPEGGRDSCGGDSGGALVLKTNGSYWAAGIVSWGLECGRPGRYGFYTHVGNYRDWLIKTMQEN